MIELVKKFIEDREYTKAQIETVVQQNLSQILADIQYQEQVVTNAVSFAPYKRCLHLLEENARIKEWEAVMQ